ncbi:MAG: carbohydrate ABC transporter permease [Caldilineaceae bacterium]
MSTQTLTQPPRFYIGKRRAALLNRWVAFALLCLGAILAILPVLWMLSTSLKASGDVLLLPPKWIPSPLLWSNYRDALTALPFGTYYANTIEYTFLAVLGETFSSAMVAYALARLRGPAHRFFFVIILSTMMLPWQVTLIPQFILFRTLGWVDSLKPLVVPTFFGSAFFIFLLNQFYQTIPDEMDDAARIDGANEYQIFWRIILPLSAPALATVAIMSFMYHWNNFLGPLIYLSSKDKLVVAVALQRFTGAYGSTRWDLLMAASLVALLPCILLFFFAQRYFIQGIVVSGVKG